MKDKQIEEEAERIALRLDPKFRDRYTEPSGASPSLCSIILDMQRD